MEATTHEPITTSGEPYQNRVTQRKQMLPVPPNVEFMLRHHPKSIYIGVIEIGKKSQAYWLPKLVPFPIRPGVLGVQSGNEMTEGYPRVNRAMLAGQDRGWVFLDNMEEYLRKHKCKHKHSPSGDFYATKFETPMMVAGTFKMKHDDQACFRWLHQLCIDKRLPIPHEEIIAGMLIKAESRMDIQANKKEKNRYTRAQFQKFAQHFENMQTAIVPGADGDPMMKPAKGKPDE